MAFEMRNLTGRSGEELTEVFNRGFKDYVIPMQLSLVQIRALLERENIDLALSVEGKLDGQNIGFCWTGIRGDVAWCGGIGVAPEHRGQGYGKLMMAHCIEEIRRQGMKRYQLECIKTNERALRLYRSLGLRVVGDLYNFKHMQPTPLAVNPGRHQVIAGSEVDLMQYWKELHRVAKSWQGDLPSLLYPTAAEQHIRLLCDEKARVIGSMTYVENPNGVMVRDLATATESVEQCLLLLAEVHAKGKPVYSQYIPEESVLVRVLQDLGYERFIDQVQMEIDL